MPVRQSRLKKVASFKVKKSQNFPTAIMLSGADEKALLDLCKKKLLILVTHHLGPSQSAQPR